MGRIILVAVLFGIFGIICLIGNLIFLPIILLGLQRFAICRNFARDLVYVAWRFFISCAVMLGYLQYRFDKKISLAPSSLIVANHPSLLDVVLILSNVRRINCIVKADLAKNIFLFPAIKASGYILNTYNEKLLNDAKDTLNRGESLLVFPEGTRTKDKIIFHKAASYIAVNVATTIVPIVIKMHPKSLQKGAKWYDTPKVKIHYNIIVKNAIDIDEFCANDTKPLACRRLNEYLNKFYQQEFSDEYNK